MSAPRNFFTSDMHFGHARVIEYCKRPFPHVDAMNEAIVERWNARVQPRDYVYILGDVALCKPEIALLFLRRLAGQKFLVFGNHDKAQRKDYERSGIFQWCADLRKIKVGEQSIVLCHFPLLTWEKAHHGAWMLHGHCHGSLKPDPRALRLDVGVDCHDFAPISFDEVSAIMAKRAFKPVDHHGAD